MLRIGLAAITAALLGACATAGGGGDAPTQGGPLSPSLRAESADFPLGGRREVKVVYSLTNTSRRVLRLDFPTAQHLEMVMRSEDGRTLFLWSEDRTFSAESSSVLVNPGERLEFQAAVPTRDMVAGRIYTAEAVLPGYPETLACASLQPR